MERIKGVNRFRQPTNSSRHKIRGFKFKLESPTKSSDPFNSPVLQCIGIKDV